MTDTPKTREYEKHRNAHQSMARAMEVNDSWVFIESRYADAMRDELLTALAEKDAERQIEHESMARWRGWNEKDQEIIADLEERLDTQQERAERAEAEVKQLSRPLDEQLSDLAEEGRDLGLPEW